MTCIMCLCGSFKDFLKSIYLVWTGRVVATGIQGMETRHLNPMI